MTTAHARNSDPDTSHAAAKSVRDLTGVQQGIVEILNWKPLTDEQLVIAYENAYIEFEYPEATPQSIRSRRAELVRTGHVEFTGRKEQLKSGRWARVWKLSEQL